MSSFQQKFNAVRLNRKELRSVKSLTVGQKYPICEIRRVQTKYGLRLLVDLDDFLTFLPERYADVFSDEELLEVNKKLENKQQLHCLCVKTVDNSGVDLEIL